MKINANIWKSDDVSTIVPLLDGAWRQRSPSDFLSAILQLKHFQSGHLFIAASGHVVLLYSAIVI